MSKSNSQPSLRHLILLRLTAVVQGGVVYGIEKGMSYAVIHTIAVTVPTTLLLGLQVGYSTRQEYHIHVGDDL